MALGQLVGVVRQARILVLALRQVQMRARARILEAADVQASSQVWRVTRDATGRVCLMWREVVAMGLPGEYLVLELAARE